MLPEATSMMQQYLHMKELYPDYILFFRLGDFYEMFSKDAELVSKRLELILTNQGRGKSEAQRTPMCDVPYHSADVYIARLIAKGYKVATYEQMEDPVLTKGLVDRDIIHIITPGTVMTSSILEGGRNNLICAVYRDSVGTGLCLCDISTNECFVVSLTGSEADKHLYNELGRFTLRGIMLSDGVYGDGALADFLVKRLDCRCENGGEVRFRPDAVRTVAEKQFSAGLDALPVGDDTVLQAASDLLPYFYETQKTNLSHLPTLAYFTTGQSMELDLTTWRDLELTETLRSKEKKGSLLRVLGKTYTAMDHRLTRAWVERSLLSPAAISRRLGAAGEPAGDVIGREEPTLTLREITDLKQLIGRTIYGTAGGRDLVILANGLGRLPALREWLIDCFSVLLASLREELDDLTELRELIGRVIVDEPPFSIREGGFIRAGYHPKVDRLRDTMTNRKGLVASIGARGKEKTGIKSLKVGYNRVLGYYIEVSKSYYDQVPDTYIHKQTLTDRGQFITQELKELEHEVPSAQGRITTLEFELFYGLQEQAVVQVGRVQHSAAVVTQADVPSSLAAVAAEQGHCRPEVDLSSAIEITGGRHPVVGKMLKHALFVPNGTHMSNRDDTMVIITGPNMAGKSAYMRQMALIVPITQIGFFIPARSVCIDIVDRVFARIGASNDLLAGQSTSMVEMTEVAELLKSTTTKSLLILDEIGRGISAYNGISTARTVPEFCADKKRLGAKTLFTTHHHEPTILEGQIPGVKSRNIAAKKKKDDTLFLHKTIRGGVDQGYGIEVAKLVGVPESILHRARKVLEKLEADVPATPAPAAVQPEEQISLLDMGSVQVSACLRDVDMNVLTPIETMNLLYELKQTL